MHRLHLPLSGRALATQAQVSEATIRNWRTKHGLARDARNKTTISQLLEFCDNNTQLPATDRVRGRLSAGPPARAALPIRAHAGDGRGALEDDPEILRGVARAARNAAQDHLEALVTSTRAHLAVLELLQASYTEIDAVLIDITTPSIPNN